MADESEDESEEEDSEEDSEEEESEDGDDDPPPGRPGNNAQRLAEDRQVRQQAEREEAAAAAAVEAVAAREEEARLQAEEALLDPAVAMARQQLRQLQVREREEAARGEALRLASQSAAEHVDQLNRSAAVLSEGGRAGQAAAVAAIGKPAVLPADHARRDSDARGAGAGAGGAAGDGLWRGGEFALGEQQRLAEEARMREAREEQRLNVARQAWARHGHRMCTACARHSRGSPCCGRRCNKLAAAAAHTRGPLRPHPHPDSALALTRPQPWPRPRP